MGAQGETTQRVAVAELSCGDRVAVAAGEVVPADGTVETGASDVDESLLTGESRRVGKQPGATLIGGSVNIASRLVMRVERVGADTVVAGIGRLLDRASSDKPQVARIADRFAAQFVASILVIAALAGLGWWFVDPDRALTIAVTVLVITCPCALSLATPAALAAANGSLTRLGVLVTRGHALETLARATHFVFDKTGTLTTGELELTAVTPLAAGDASRALALAVAMERDSRHPIASAFLAANGERRCETILGLQDVRDVAGRGIEAVHRGRRLRIGRADFVAELTGTPVPDAVDEVAEHLQVVVLGGEDGWIALFTLNDRLRPRTRRLIASLRAEGREVLLLTGDRESIAHYTARELGIARVHAGARPEDKHRLVRELQDGGTVVAMIGDGVNDAPVLAQAQVSVAMGGGADLARASADVILGDSALERLQDIIDVARKTRRVIAENLFWATVYNLVAVPAAVTGVVTPLMASVGMAASSLVVVVNALRAAHPALWRPMSSEPAALSGMPQSPRPSVNAV
jgi:Cu2+-exporting ATPase